MEVSCAVAVEDEWLLGIGAWTFLALRRVPLLALVVQVLVLCQHIVEGSLGYSACTG